MIRAFVHFDGAGGGAPRRSRSTRAQPFPTSMKVDVPAKARWYDAYGYLVLYNKDENGDTIGVAGCASSDRRRRSTART